MKRTIQMLCAAGVLTTALKAEVAVGPVEVSGRPVGVITRELATGNHALALPLLRETLYVGLVSGNTGNTLTVQSGDPAEALTAGGQYYLEVATGAFEGERLDLNTAATLAAPGGTLVVDFGGYSTADSLPAGALAEARVVVRRHVMLSDLPGLFSPALTGNNSAARADTVQVVRDGRLAMFYLFGDGASWREPGSLVDHRHRVLPPDSGILVQLRSGAKSWKQAGGVRSHAFRVRLEGGLQGFATGFPVDLSFLEVGAYVNPEAPAGVRWVGNDNPEQADTFRLYEAGTNTFPVYHLKGDGTTWNKEGEDEDVAAEPLLEATGLVIVSRQNPEPEYLIIRPFDL